jgi:hypothetical protein
MFLPLVHPRVLLEYIICAQSWAVGTYNRRTEPQSSSDNQEPSTTINITATPNLHSALNNHATPDNQQQKTPPRIQPTINISTRKVTPNNRQGMNKHMKIKANQIGSKNQSAWPPPNNPSSDRSSRNFDPSFVSWRWQRQRHFICDIVGYKHELDNVMSARPLLTTSYGCTL